MCMCDKNLNQQTSGNFIYLKINSVMEGIREESKNKMFEKILGEFPKCLENRWKSSKKYRKGYKII